jgi:mycothiol synthase
VTATVSVRAPRDAGEVARLVNEASRAEHGVDDFSEAEIARWFSHPELDPERDMFIAEENGKPVAYADVSDSSETGEQFWIDLRLPPDASGSAGDALVEAATRRALEIAAVRDPRGRPRIIADASSTNTRAAAVLERAGFSLYRHSYRMVIEVGDDVAEPRFPEGLDVRTFAVGQERAVFDVVNEAFEDSYDHVRGSFDEWRHWMLESDSFDAELWWLVYDGDELAALCLCRPYEAEPDMGWVASLAVRRRWRRRGIARALLLTAFREFQRRGFARVGLGVDADSLTGADRLYESAGMRPIRRHDMYERALE